jgi:hypothetical protein
MNWITLLDLVIIHERVIEETGGVHGVTNPGGLESALARPGTGSPTKPKRVLIFLLPSVTRL